MQTKYFKKTHMREYCFVIYSLAIPNTQNDDSWLWIYNFSSTSISFKVFLTWQNIRRWYRQFATIECFCKGKCTGRPKVTTVYWSRQKKSVGKQVLNFSCQRQQCVPNVLPELGHRTKEIIASITQNPIKIVGSLRPSTFRGHLGPKY